MGNLRYLYLQNDTSIVHSTKTFQLGGNASGMSPIPVANPCDGLAQSPRAIVIVLLATIKRRGECSSLSHSTIPTLVVRCQVLYYQ